MDKNPHLQGTPDEFIEKNIGLAQKVAWRFIKWAHNKENIKFDKDDFLSIAYLGLCKAYMKYDPTNFQGADGGKIKFSTYAMPIISGEIMRHVRDLSHTVRKSRDGKGPENLDSLDRAITENDDNSMNVGDTIQAESCDMDERVILNDFLDRVDFRAQRIYKLREQGRSQSEIGEILGVSQVQISRIETQFYDLAEQYGRGEMGNMPRNISMENAKRMREEIKTIDQFNSLGTIEDISKQYELSIATVYNWKKSLEGEAPNKNTNTPKANSEKDELVSIEEHPEVKTEQPESPDSIEEVWDDIVIKLSIVRKMYVDKAEKEFRNRLAQVVGE